MVRRIAEEGSRSGKRVLGCSNCSEAAVGRGKYSLAITIWKTEECANVSGVFPLPATRCRSTLSRERQVQAGSRLSCRQAAVKRPWPAPRTRLPPQPEAARPTAARPRPVKTSNSTHGKSTALARERRSGTRLVPLSFKPQSYTCAEDYDCCIGTNLKTQHMGIRRP